MIFKALWGVVESGPPQPKPAPKSPRDPNYDPPTPWSGARGRRTHGHESRRDWTGWVTPSGGLRALRKGSWSYAYTQWLWVFECLHCGQEVERRPTRLEQKPYVRSCGCARRAGSIAALQRKRGGTVEEFQDLRASEGPFGGTESNEEGAEK